MNTLPQRFASPLGCLAAILLTFASPARATQSYVVNGSFETTTNGTGQLGYNTNATGWTNVVNGGVDGYNFLFAPGTADTTGATGVDGNIKLWGPGDGSAMISVRGRGDRDAARCVGVTAAREID